MTDTTAKIRAKGCDATGITEEIANVMFDSVGKHYMGIVEFKVEEPHGPTTDGKRRVDLVLTQVEPATDPALADHLRELTRTVYFNRKNDGHQGDLFTAGSDEPTVERVMAAGAQLKPHPFIPANPSDDNPICDVCGVIESAGPHNLDDPDEPEDLDEDLEGGDIADSSWADS